MGSFLIPCPHCDCHAKSAELTCPSCGEPLRRSDGSVPRTAVAVLLGLTAAGALGGACGPTVATFYGVSVTSGAGGAGGRGGGGGGGGGDADTSSSSSSSAVFYGPAMTSSSSGNGGADGGDGG